MNTRSIAFLVLAGLCPGAAAAPYTAVPNVIHSSATDWVNAARTGRADILVMGDSIVGSFGPGIERAAAKHVGLAGTSLMPNGGNGANGYSINIPYPLDTHGWNHDVSGAPADRQAYAWNVGDISNAGSAPARNYFWSIAPGGPLQPQAAYNWEIWTASQPGGGSMAARRSLGEPPYSENYLLPAQATATPANGLQKVTFNFPAVTGHDGKVSQGALADVTNTSIFYSRLLKPGNPTGATVSSWNLGGASALQYLQGRYLTGPSSQAGRGQLYSALTDGGSGKLMVVLLFGINDRGRDFLPSAHGITPGNTPEAYIDNVTTLIDQVKADWAATGKNPDDLSFLVNGLYVDGADADSGVPGRTREFAQVLHNLALTRPDISFFDIFPHAPSHADAVALGYMADPVHPTLLGASAYADAMIGALVPEPGALAFIGVALAITARRRRRA